MPREIDLKEVMWLTITPENYEEQFAIIEEQEGELVFLAMTIPDYETMAYNMQELKRYITELKDVVVYYRKVTTEDATVDKEPINLWGLNKDSELFEKNPAAQMRFEDLEDWIEELEERIIELETKDEVSKESVRKWAEGEESG